MTEGAAIQSSGFKEHRTDHAASEVTVRRVIGAFFEVYNRLGYGFLEVVYARALEVEVQRRGLRVEREVPLEAYYKNELVGSFRADLVVADSSSSSSRHLRVRIPTTERSSTTTFGPAASSPGCC